jgi:hypothetical protein
MKDIFTTIKKFKEILGSVAAIITIITSVSILFSKYLNKPTNTTIEKKMPLSDTTPYLEEKLNVLPNDTIVPILPNETENIIKLEEKPTEGIIKKVHKVPHSKEEILQIEDQDLLKTAKEEFDAGHYFTASELYHQIGDNTGYNIFFFISCKLKDDANRKNELLELLNYAKELATNDKEREQVKQELLNYK